MKRNLNTSPSLADNQPQDRKKLILRFAAFAVFLVIAVVAVTVGVSNLNRVEEGLQTIEASLDKEVPLYQSGVSFRHWFSGSSSAIRLGVKELTELYSASLKDVYRLLDPENSYESWTNLATVNQNRGREITVPRELYELLRQADALTRRGGAYNLYAGAFYAEWESLRYQLEPEASDPLNDPEEAERLRRLAEASAELSNFSLEFLDDAGCSLRFTVSEGYLALLRELELTEAPILDLNLLEDAFKLQLTAERLEQRGYDCGYLSTDSGLTLALSACPEGGSYALYGAGEGKPLPAAWCPMLPGSSAAFLRAFALEDEAGYYSLERDGAEILRHPWLPADGQDRQLLEAALVRGAQKSLPETCYACLQLYSADSLDRAGALLAELPGFDAALLLRQTPDTVYIRGAVEAVGENGYHSEPIP